MRAALWIGLMAVSALSGRWWGDEPALIASVAEKSDRHFTLLDKRSASGEMPLRSHSCLTATAEALPDILAKAQGRSVSGYSPEVLLVAARWFQLDREGLLAWLGIPAKPQPRMPQPLRIIVSRWLAEEDSEATWKRLDPLWHHRDRDLIDALDQADPARSFEAEDQSYRLRAIMKSWAKKDFAAAVDAVKAAKHWKQSNAVVGLAEAQASQLPFEEAFAWARDFEVLPEIAMSTVIDQLAKTDLEAALRHLSEAGISKSRHMANTLWALERLPIEQSVALLEKYPTRLSLIRSLADLPRDPVKAAQVIAPISNDLERINLHYSWRPESSDIPKAMADLARETDHVAYRALLERSLDFWHRDHPELVADFITNMPDAVRQSEYAHKFGGRNLDLLQLIDKRLLGDDLNEALVATNIREAIYSKTHMDPHEAASAAAELHEPAFQSIAHKAVFVGWAEHDEAAAVAWAESLPPSQRQAAEMDELIATTRKNLP